MELTKPDGRQFDVHLDSDFKVLDSVAGREEEGPADGDEK